MGSWTVRLVPLAVTVVLVTGCGQPADPTPSGDATPTPAASSPMPGPSPSATPTAQPSAPATPEPEPVRMLEITLADGKAEPNGEKIELAKGEPLDLVVTSDRDDELHVHGIDLEIPVAAGETVTKRVVIEQTGRFEVESHHPELLIAQLIVR